MCDGVMITYRQVNLELPVYSDKQRVLTDGIHIEPIGVPPAPSEGNRVLV